MKKLLCALLLPLSLIPAAHADNCSSIDVRRQLKPAMREYFSHPQNQSDLGWCFAYVAADLLSYRYQVPVSAYDIGLTHSNSVTSIGAFFRNIGGLNVGDINGGGDVIDAIRSVQSRGAVCANEDVVSTVDTLQTATMDLQEIQAYIAAAGKVEGWKKMVLTYSLKQRYPHVDPDQVLRFLAANPGGSSAKTLQMLDQKVCSAHLLPVSRSLQFAKFVPSIGRGDNTGTDRLSDAVDHALRQGKLVSVSYKPQLLLKPGRIASGFLSLFNGHVSSIVGRQRVGGQCMYVVRNSWGESCEHYNDRVICNPKDYTFMVTRDDLNAVATDIEYIRN